MCSVLDSNLLSVYINWSILQIWHAPQVITVLLTTHPKIVHSSTCSLIPSLTVLLSTLKNKVTITSYLKVVALLLAYVFKQCNKDVARRQVSKFYWSSISSSSLKKTHSTFCLFQNLTVTISGSVQARPCVSLIACRRPPSSSSSAMELTAVASLVSVTVTHVERLWLEDVPPQVLILSLFTVHIIGHCSRPQGPINHRHRWLIYTISFYSSEDWKNLCNFTKSCSTHGHFATLVNTQLPNFCLKTETTNALL